MKTTLALTLALATLVPSVALAEDVREPTTGHAFAAQRTVDGQRYVLTGVGLRKEFIVKLYAMALYVEEAGAKAAKAAGKADDKQRFVAEGGFGKFGVLRLLRDVSGEKMRESFKNGLEGALADAELKEAAESFIALFDRDMKEGEEIHIHTSPGGQVEVFLAGQKKAGPKVARLAPHIWNMWLGAKTISRNMRESLVARVDQL